MFASAPLIRAVHPSLPASSVRELVELARKRPNEIHYASAGIGSNIHLTTELFKHMARISLVQVPYKGGGPASVGLITGEAQVLFSSVLSALPFVKSGRMRALAVSTKQRSPILPDLPTIHESGVPGYDKSAWFALFAPSRVPDAVIHHVYRATTKVLKHADTAKRLAAEGAIAVGNPPEAFTAFVHAEIDEWSKLIRAMNVSPAR
jgi:tripartite-type tricarboxylate transporter receptor subunit TctC